MTGIRSPNARATTSPPKNIEPVSPINTFAGWKFHTKKPRQTPASAAANRFICTKPSMEEMTRKPMAATIVTEDASPSMPSVRLTALTAPMMMNSMTG